MVDRHFNCRFRGAILGPLNGVTQPETPPAYVLATSFMSQYEKLVQVSKYGSLQLAAFGDGMTNLRQGGWVDVIRSFVDSGRPFLGVCLGLQLLFEGSEEDAPNPRQPVPGRPDWWECPASKRRTRLSPGTSRRARDSTLRI